MLITIDRGMIKIKDDANGIDYKGAVTGDRFQNSKSIVFCEINTDKVCRLLLYKDGRITEIAEDSEIEIFYSDLNIDHILFTKKGKNKKPLLMDLYLYDKGKVTILHRKINRECFSRLILNDTVVFIYLALGSSKAKVFDLWDVYEADLNGSEKLIETDVIKSDVFLSRKNELKYILCKWITSESGQYIQGFGDKSFTQRKFSLVIINGTKRKEFYIDFNPENSDFGISFLGFLILIWSQKLYYSKGKDVVYVPENSPCSLLLVDTESLELLVLDEISDSEHHYSLYMPNYFISKHLDINEYVDVEELAQEGVNIESSVIKNHPQYFKSERKSNNNLEYQYNIYFSREGNELFNIAMELSQLADRSLIFDSPYPLDNSQNVLLSYSEKNIENFLVMQELFSTKFLANSQITFLIYGIDIRIIMSDLDGGKHSSGFDLENFVRIQKAIRELKKYYQIESNYELKDILEINILSKYCIYTKITVEEAAKKRYKNIIKEVEHKLIKENRLPTKWKSEQELFRLVSRFFEDAIFHYTDEWISPQHIDIFIPQIQCAIEYQGEQHFLSSDYFGGDDYLENRKLLDDRKRSLCKEIGIILIEWRYDEPINEVILDKKLRAIHIPREQLEMDF